MRTRFLVTGVATLAVLGASVSSAAPASSSPPSQDSVKQLLIHAAKTESAAYQQYYAYAEGARRTGRVGLAGVWRTIGQVERYDHWSHELSLAGLYSDSDNAANLKLAITQAQDAAAADSKWAAEAPKYSAAGHVLSAVAARETNAAKLLTQALGAVQGNGSVPTAPAVRTVAVRVAPQPYYSGAFYNDLTSGSNSALETAAWNWAQYQVDGQTAANTGHADLAALLSGLEAQEVQSWTELSNVAGYVNGNTLNLQTSKTSEQGAITMYTEFANQADQAGDPTAAAAFRSILGDEKGHYQSFSTELTGGH